MPSSLRPKATRRRFTRSEERRVGEEGRSRWAAYHLKKKKKREDIPTGKRTEEEPPRRWRGRVSVIQQRNPHSTNNTVAHTPAGADDGEEWENTDSSECT